MGNQTYQRAHWFDTQATAIQEQQRLLTVKIKMLLCVTTQEKSDNKVNVEIKKKLTLLENYEHLV